jgi:DNA-binding Lrp family transcriptional regulator
VRQYAEALGISRQAASVRLKRYVDLGLLVVAGVNRPQSLADLATRDPHASGPVNVYRAAKSAT